MIPSSPTRVLVLRRTRLVVVGVLLLGALGLGLHPLFGHAGHGPDQTCEICLHLGVNPAAPAVAPLPPLPRPVAFTPPAPVARTRTAPAPHDRSRAPPAPLVIV